jgi:histidyl-tRNA synthetase
MKNVKQVMRELDKLEKIGEDEVKVNLRKYASANQIVTLFKLLEKDLKFYKENAFDGADELDELIKECKSYGVKVKFRPTMVRGFAYYTGNIFELKIPGKNTIVAGGRYDKTVGKYLNNDIPAVGASFSIEALTGICAEEISQLKTDIYPKALIISLEQDNESVKLAKKLRKNEISCFVSFAKIGKALDYANSQKIPFVIFLGDEEVSKNKFKLKDMISGGEKLLSEKQLINKLKKR